MTAEYITGPQVERWEAEDVRLRDRLERAKQQLTSLPRPSKTPNDPAYVNLRWHREDLDRDVERGFAVAKAEALVEAFESRLQYHEKTKPVPFTLDELKAARAVRLDYGWAVPVRVNKKTITVRGDAGLTYRYPLHNVLEVRA